MTYHFRNLVFEGGGVKGIAYFDPMKLFEDKGVFQIIKNIGDVIAGSVIAILVGFWHSVTAILKISWSIVFNKIIDDYLFLLRCIARLMVCGGCFGSNNHNAIGRFFMKN